MNAMREAPRLPRCEGAGKLPILGNLTEGVSYRKKYTPPVFLLRKNPAPSKRGGQGRLRRQNAATNKNSPYKRFQFRKGGS